ncbi:MAG: PEP-CTERM sorting domain-containing protein [Fimbriimonadales bacterium]|nr:MAG: hypothetical protein KatS3mg018_2139 [Fimbriimonadales bacterium]
MKRMEMMRIGAVIAIGAILAQTFVFANYTIVHRRTFNLNSTFAGAEAIGDVAFDGNNLYVSSWHNASGTQTLRLTQVGDLNTLLNTNSGALTPSGWSVTVSAAGSSRDTRLVYHNNYLYWGYGLGDGNTSNTGIRKYDLSGNLDTSWASSGTLTLSGASVNRYDTIDIDPGYSGSGETLAVGVFGSTIVRRFNLGTGANAGNAGPVGGQTSTRDYAFAPNGDLYIRTQGAIAVATRAGVSGSAAFNAPTNIQTWSEGTLAQAFVAYIPVNEVYFSGFSSLVLYNQRVTGQNKIFIYNVGNGAIVGVSELNGSELVDDGNNPVDFQNTFLNASWGFANGRMFIFVVNGFTGGGVDTGYTSGGFDRLDIYEVVPEPASMLALGTGLASLLALRCRKK